MKIKVTQSSSSGEWEVSLYNSLANGRVLGMYEYADDADFHAKSWALLMHHEVAVRVQFSNHSVADYDASSTSTSTTRRVVCSNGIAQRVVAVDRAESDSCERLTPSCCIDHKLSASSVGCDTW